MMFNNSNSYSDTQSSEATLTCCFCKEAKPIDDFSDVNQQRAGIHKSNEFRYPIKPGSAVSCKACTYSPTQTLRCENCKKTKSLDSFSKPQRRNGDHPWCAVCVIRVKDQPGWSM